MKRYCHFLLFLVLVGVVMASPSIESLDVDLVDGAVITVSGSGFGIKNPVEPVLWDDFDNGTAFNQIQNERP